LADPTDQAAVLVVCQHLPQRAHFSGSQSGHWVAWSGSHDVRGHGGVFARRVWPTMGPPIMVFNGCAHALAWGGDRLALLLSVPGNDIQMVWAVWDPPHNTEGSAATPSTTPAYGCCSTRKTFLLISPRAFELHSSFVEHLNYIQHDQGERRSQIWNSQRNAIVFVDAETNVWIQPFPPTVDLHSDAKHPLADLVGAEDSARSAPDPLHVAQGLSACWSPG